ncbi:hypothetical protein BH18GEM1_BH18GEM1_18710 [soil metagenome]
MRRWTFLLLALSCSAEGADRPAELPESAGLAAAPERSRAATDSVAIEEWVVPWEDTRPRDPAVDSGRDRIWFVGQVGDYLAWLDPASGSFERIDLSPGAGPHNVVVAPDGIVWYAGNGTAHIGRVDPATGGIEQVPMPDPGGRDPHTLAVGPEGEIWFTVQTGNSVGRLDRATREVRLIPVPTRAARPYGIVVDGDGRPWFTEFGSHKLGTIDPATMELREYELPRTEARPRRVVITSDNGVWYVDYAEGYVGRLDPATGAVREWRAPGGEESLPYAMAVDDGDRIWFVETGPEPNRLVGFDPAGEEFVWSQPVPSGGGSVRHMVYDPAERAIWFGTDAGTIGRARLP